MNSGLGMLGAIGDLVEDVVVQLLEDVNVASDTTSRITRRRGGSAANVVEAACRAKARARFIGQVGDDATGRWLTEQLEAMGADVRVRWIGRSGTIVVLVHANGERSMFPDRAACTELADPDPSWLDDLHTLHIPYYSLVGEPLASTTRTLATWAHERGITVSVDASSAALLQHDGADVALANIAGLGPQVVLANELEAAALGPGLTPERLGGAMVVVKQGSGPARVHCAGADPFDVPAVALEHVADTTGAGDAFAAGLLVALAEGAAPAAAVKHAHRIAADVLSADRSAH